MTHVYVVPVKNLRNAVGDNMDQDLTTEMMIADILLRLKSMENIFISKGIFTEQEYLKEMELVAQQISRALLEQSKVQGNIDELIKSMDPNRAKS